MTKNDISQGLVKELFEYKDGFLYWKKAVANNVKIGERAGSLQFCKGVYRRSITVNKMKYVASRIIFLWHKGYLPPIVDHIDRNTENDRIDNLRPATQLQNACNKKAKAFSTSAYLGVSYVKKKGKWTSQIAKAGVRKYLGYFVTEEEAALAYNKAAIEIHGEFASINKVELI